MNRPAGAELIGRVLALALSIFVGDVLRVRRAHVERAMARAGVARPAETARAMYRALGRGLVALVGMALGRRPRAHVPEEALEALRARGTGAVVATAHTGCWDVMACAVARVTPLTVVTKRLRVGLLDRLWQGARRREGVRLVEARGAAREASLALARGQLVAMIIDQAPERSRGVVLGTFLGAPAWIDLAPALTALRARVPLVAAFPLVDADGAHRVVIARVLEPPRHAARGSHRRWAAEAMLEVTRALEELVREHPEQWLWMHRRWKPLPGGLAAAPDGAPVPGASFSAPGGTPSPASAQVSPGSSPSSRSLAARRSARARSASA
jgi:KDO2-lipid IV(A) lauroyltransferase